MTLKFWQWVYELLEKAQERMYQRYILPHYPQPDAGQIENIIKDVFQQIHQQIGQCEHHHQERFFYRDPATGAMTEIPADASGNIKYDA